MTCKNHSRNILGQFDIDEVRDFRLESDLSFESAKKHICTHSVWR